MGGGFRHSRHHTSSANNRRQVECCLSCCVAAWEAHFGIPDRIRAQFTEVTSRPRMANKHAPHHSATEAPQHVATAGNEQATSPATSPTTAATNDHPPQPPDRPLRYYERFMRSAVHAALSFGNLSAPARRGEDAGARERYWRGWTNWDQSDIDGLVQPTVLLDGTSTWERLAVRVSDWRNPEGAWWQTPGDSPKHHHGGGVALITDFHPPDFILDALNSSLTVVNVGDTPFLPRTWSSQFFDAIAGVDTPFRPTRSPRLWTVNADYGDGGGKGCVRVGTD